MDYLEVARLHTVWRNMMSRCFNENNAQYDDYGGRGITVVREWRNFNAFCQWALDHGSAPGLHVDRRDNDGPYAPWNCHIVPPSINARNTRRNHPVTAFGETKLLIEWAEDPRCAVTDSTLRQRIKAGWEPEEAITCKHTRDRQDGFRKCGHPRDDEHSYLCAGGRRICKPCALERARKVA